MSYVPLTQQEAIAAAAYFTTYTCWQRYTKYGDQLYGDAWKTLEAESYSEYNDEGGYTHRLASITVQDAAGAYLDYDLSTPYMRLILAEVLHDVDKGGAVDDWIVELRTYLEDPAANPPLIHEELLSEYVRNACIGGGIDWDDLEIEDWDYTFERAAPPENPIGTIYKWVHD